MGLESAYYIWDLNYIFPDGQDDIGEARDHLTMIKEVLKNTFPNFNKNPAPGAVDNYVHISSDELNKFDSVYTLIKDVPGNVIGASIEGTIKATAYSTIFKNMLFKFDPIGGTGLELAQPMIPLGSIITSLFNKTQMDLVYGEDNFMLCDGRDIPNGKLLKTHFPRFTKTPDLRDRIISQAKIEADLYKPAEPKTKWVINEDYTPIDLTPWAHDHTIPNDPYFDGFNHVHDDPIFWTAVVLWPGSGSRFLANTYNANVSDPNYYTEPTDAITEANADTHGHKFTIVRPADKPNGFNYPARAVINYYMRVN